LNEKYVFTRDVLLPLEVCQQIGLEPKDELNISIVSNSIVLTKAVRACVFCDTAVELVKIGQYYVCENCHKRLAKAKSGDCLY